MHPESSREADDLTVWSSRSSRLFGWASRMRAKDFVSAGPAAMTGSQPSDMVVPLQQKTCTPTTISPPHSHVLLFPAENFERWQSWFTLHHWAHHKQDSSQQFSTQCHLCQKTELGSDLSGRDECSSCSHLHEGNSVQMQGLWDIQHNRPPGLEQHFHNTAGIH